MNGNQTIVSAFYDAFSKLDHKGMTELYNDDPVFNDPAFGVLQGDEVRAMWKMLCMNAKDFTLTYKDVECDGEYCTCKWTANYTFSKTGRKVVNNVKAHMRMQDGKISEHTDEFDIYRWSRQAFGIPGVLLGWSGYMKNKIRAQAKGKLYGFMKDS